MPTSLTDQTLKQLLDSFSSSDPTPGGGSAAALAGALGVSLLVMVSGLPKTRSGAEDERAALDGVRPRLTNLQRVFTELVDRDAAAYDLVVAAFKLPKATDEDKNARKAAIQAAMKTAADVPMETFRTALDAMNAGEIVAQHGNTSAKSDVSVATHLLMTAAQGAFMNVVVNLGAISDPAVVESFTLELRQCVGDMGRAVQTLFTSPAMASLMEDVSALTGIRQGPTGQ